MSHAGKLFWVATILANVSFAWAGSLYVSPTGSDGNTGDADHPWLTLQHAANVVNPGDTVNVGPGTYQGFYESRSGTADSPITWLAQPGTQITSNETHFNRDGIILYGASYVTVEGFSISGVTRAGIASQNNTNCTVRNNQCDSNGTWGVFTGHSEYFTVEDNICSRSGTQHGIYVSNSADHPVIRNNICWGNSGCGIQINADRNMLPGDGIVSYALIENNICYENGATGGAALNMDGLQDSIIRNNLLYNNHAGGLVMYMGDGAEGPKNDIVENNTIVQAADGRWAVNIGTGQSGIVLRNNILYEPSTSRGAIKYDTASSPINSDYNILVNRMSVDGGTIMDLSTWQAQTGNDLHSILATPDQLFVDPANNDYRLKSGSLAINAGTAVADVLFDRDGRPRPIGVAGQYDIGAYEYVLGGDTNYDGKVSFSDYLALEQNFGKSGTWAKGDFTGDGLVKFADYLILEQGFGKSISEPATLGLVLAGLMGLRRRR